MNEHVTQNLPFERSMSLASVRPKYLADDALLSKVDNLEDLDSDKLTLEERHALYMHAFALNLADEGLRSPDYYRDSSPCISFHEDAWPAWKGIFKAKVLKLGYLDPEDLIERLNKLKPTDNFALRKYRHRQIKWDKSPIPQSPGAVSPPEPDWFENQMFWLGQQMRKRRPYTDRDMLIIKYLEEAKKYWRNIRDIELSPLPDLHLLKHISRSPSGTLFPRCLVIGLHMLREHANARGKGFYEQEYEKAKTKRAEIIQCWQDENPDSILADDPVSVFRTWPQELMAQLNAVDQEAMRCGSGRYAADLRETESKMQELVSFWRDCKLITGIRTPPSPQWPDPKAKLKGLHWPDYLCQRKEAIRQQFGFSDEATKRETVEFARWKEAVINTEMDPCTSEMPLSLPLQARLDIAWQGYECFLDREDVEDDMMSIIGEWRKSCQWDPCTESLNPPQLDREAGAEGTTTERVCGPMYRQSPSHHVQSIATNRDADLDGVMQSPSVAPVQINNSTRKLSRADYATLKEASLFLRNLTRGSRRSSNHRADPTAAGKLCSGRLPSKLALESASPRRPNAHGKRAGGPRGVSKRRIKGRIKTSQQQDSSRSIPMSQQRNPLSSRLCSRQDEASKAPLETKRIVSYQYHVVQRTQSN
ncbi:MAG: hypothetical protein LQ346_001311 [Caloplaca aetnensis]|nr:MAG: hypothetical protein LQ346_001311 [Caloplaca aetnensis]